jgi:hypothetical protein
MESAESDTPVVVSHIRCLRRFGQPGKMGSRKSKDGVHDIVISSPNVEETECNLSVDALLRIFRYGDLPWYFLNPCHKGELVTALNILVDST